MSSVARESAGKPVFGKSPARSASDSGRPQSKPSTATGLDLRSAANPPFVQIAAATAAVMQRAELAGSYRRAGAI